MVQELWRLSAWVIPIDPALFVYVYEEGTVVFSKHSAHPPIDDRFYPDKREAFGRYLENIKRPSMAVLLKNLATKVLSVALVATLIFSGGFGGALALTFAGLIEMDQAWQASFFGTALMLVAAGWNTLKAQELLISGMTSSQSQ